MYYIYFTCKKKSSILTYQHKVHSTDTTLGESNYTPMTLPEKLKIILGNAKGDKNCTDTVYEFFIKDRPLTEGANNVHIFWLKNQAQLLQTKRSQQKSMRFITFL